MTKNFKIIECLGIKDWYDNARQGKKLNNLTVSTLWTLRKNMKLIIEAVDNFNEFKTNLEDEIKNKYFNDEKSQDAVVKDENDQDINVRRVKDEFLPEYQKDIEEINKKLNQLVGTEETFNFIPINMEAEIEKLGDSCALDIDDLDILSIFEEENEEGQN